MPYIKENRRQDLHKSANLLALYPNQCPANAGELNYTITELIHNYLMREKNRGDYGYTKLNEVIGVLECAKLELYRQVAAPYEDIKKKENGNISGLDK